MRSISTKLILAFLSIGIISVLVIAVTAVWSTRAEFIRFLTDQTQTDVVTQLSDYHRTYGSWERVESIFIYSNHGQQPGMGPGPRKRQPFALANANGRIIIPNGPYHRGETLSAAALEAGIPIMENGAVIGFLIPLRGQFEGAPRELEFIQRINRLLLYGALIGAVIALLLGIFLSRTLTRPIRELTQATHAVSEGDLSQQVPIRSNDELGELAQAFNKMSSELSRSVHARRQMTADIAHELRTPLSLILGHAEAVHDGVLPPTRE
ncbi:MAG TPA: HAMP domain-containing protein, partial [Anaerolineales bacterium]|nr:HAMP domain-containing protein [Anaerolineales bacterium]